jgi:hypothetical protein
MCKGVQESKQFNNNIIIIIFNYYLQNVIKLLLVKTVFSQVLLQNNSKFSIKKIINPQKKKKTHYKISLGPCHDIQISST